MQAVETIKNRGQTKLNNLLANRKAHSYAVKTWGMTAGGAVVGAVTVAATAQGMLALLAFLAAPPVAVTVGMLGGGALGWRYMHHSQANGLSGPPMQRTTPVGVDDLELITGITPTYASRLHAAGIHTFAQLAALLPERVHLIIGPMEHGAIIQSERWIADAGQLAQQREG